MQRTFIGWPTRVAPTTALAYYACVLSVVPTSLFARKLGDSWTVLSAMAVVAMAFVMWRSRTMVSVSREEVVVRPDGMFGRRYCVPVGGLVRAEVGSEPSLILTMSSGETITVGPWAPVSSKSLRTYEEKCTNLAGAIQKAIERTR